MDNQIKRILDKLVLLSGAAILMFLEQYNILGVAGLFVSIGLSFYYEYWRKGVLLRIMAIVLVLGAVWQPVLILWSGVYLYDLLYEKEWICFWGTLIGTVLISLQLSTIVFIWVGLFVLIAVLLAYTSSHYELLDKEHKVQRDASRELELILKNKNRDLMEKQDYEVHLATLQERNRIAREIHDNVGHLLSRSILQVGALKAINGEKKTMEGTLVSLGETLDQAMTSIRSSVHNLHDEAIDLRLSIETILEQYKDYKISFSYDLPQGLSKEIKYCFLTIVKEALVNIVKHSDGDRVQIVMKEFTDLYQLIIRDNGSAYEEHKDSGIGLNNMRERVEAFHGGFHYRFQQGFQIFVTIPKVEGVVG